MKAKKNFGTKNFCSVSNTIDFEATGLQKAYPTGFFMKKEILILSKRFTLRPMPHRLCGIGYALIRYFKCVFWRHLGTADLNQLSTMKFIVKVNTKCKLDKSFGTRFTDQLVRKVLSSAIFHYQRLSLDTLIQTSKYRNR